jgi:CTD small phosphatase-like protein 2
MLGRDIKRVIIIDNVSENFQMQYENGIFISSWVGDETDDTLLHMAKLLKTIAAAKPADVRITLRNYRDRFMRKLMEA